MCEKEKKEKKKKKNCFSELRRDGKSTVGAGNMHIVALGSSIVLDWFPLSTWIMHHYLQQLTHWYRALLTLIYFCI